MYNIKRKQKRFEKGKVLSFLWSCCATSKWRIKWMFHFNCLEMLRHSMRRPKYESMPHDSCSNLTKRFVCFNNENSLMLLKSCVTQPIHLVHSFPIIFFLLSFFSLSFSLSLSLYRAFHRSSVYFMCATCFIFLFEFRRFGSKRFSRFDLKCLCVSGSYDGI